VSPPEKKVIDTVDGEYKVSVLYKERVLMSYLRFIILLLKILISNTRIVEGRFLSLYQ